MGPQMHRAPYLIAAEAWYVARGWLPETRARRHAQRALYREFVHSGDLCFDIGANIGDRTRAFLSLGARVVAVDPQPSCIQRLHFAFGRNPRVAIMSQGVGAEPGEADLAICDAAPAISTMSRAWRETGRFAGSYQWARTVRVPVTTLDALIQRFGVPAFCKIDVEGYEDEVLRGLSHPIPALSFEFIRDGLELVEACLARLAALGSVRANYALGESMQWASPHWVGPTEILAELTRLPLSENPWGDIYVRFA